MRTNLQIYDKHVAFFGSAFSNFFPCSFILNEPFDTVYEITKTKNEDQKDFIWKSSEQCFMAYKAYFFMDFETFGKIMFSETPREAKKLGRQVKNFDDEIWSKVRYKIMHKIVLEKFSQNENLKDLILSDDFKGKDFVEGSPFDAIWGVKMDWRNPDIDNEENWEGQNLLGKVLNKVREELLKDGEEIKEE